MILFLELSEK